MSKRVRDIYGFQVMDEIKNGANVYGVDKANSDTERIVYFVNDMDVESAASLLYNPSADFWIIEEEEEVKEESVNG